MQKCTVCGADIPPGDTVCPHCGRAHYGAVCASCRQPAPTLVRGGQVVCSGCGATRGPLSGVPLNMVGSAHRAGSVLTTVLSIAVILGGIALGGVVGTLVALISGIFGQSAALGIGLGLVLSSLGGVAGYLGLRGSRALRERGEAARDAAFEQSILAMAANRAGSVTTTEVAQNLGLPLRDADRLLTEMGRKGRATVEVNREGLLQYTFRDVRGALLQAPAPQGSTGVRIAAEGPAQERSPAEVARETVSREFEEMAARRKNGRF